MKTNKKLLTCTMAMSLALTSQLSVFAASNIDFSKADIPVINMDYGKLTEKGEIPYCEFIRLVVIETVGEQPEIMDTHYAMPYILKAEELGLIENMPMEKWLENISRDQLNKIIDQLEPQKKADIIKKLNNRLVDSITLNGTHLDLGDLKTTIVNGNIMVPLRKIAEELDFTILWDQNTYTAILDNGTIKTSVQIGFDNYYKSSSTETAVVEPIQYGTAPMLIEGDAYVPAQLFSLLFDYADSVTVTNGVLSIISK